MEQLTNIMVEKATDVKVVMSVLKETEDIHDYEALHVIEAMK